MTTLLDGRTTRGRRATMHDVARLAGVSVKTVSRVVNDEPGVGEQTAARVRAAIEALAFRRHLGARNLRRGATTSTIGLLLEDVANPFYSALTRGAEEVARRYGTRVLTASSDEDPDHARELALEFCARRVDGLMIVPAGTDQSYLREEVAAGTPVVFLDRPGGNLDADTVLVDNYGGMTQAVAHLVEHGHRRIGFLGDAPEIYTAERRLAGYRDGRRAADVPADEELVAMGPHTDETVAAAAQRMLSLPEPATAFLGGNNRITIALLRALHRVRPRPALIGFDDFELADLLDPPVTVIAHDPKTLGRVAARQLFTRMEGDATAAREIVLSTRLFARGSGELAP